VAGVALVVLLSCFGLLLLAFRVSARRRAVEGAMF
jgi:hypothetical protein